MSDHHYCPLCGDELETDNGHDYRCPSCKNWYRLTPIPIQP